MYHLEWTDPAGTVHVWIVGTGETLCGRPVGLHTETPPQETCESCRPLGDNLRQRHHHEL